MERDELIEIVQKIMNPVGKTEKDIEILMEELERNVPHPGVSDLIYFEENSAEEVVDKALNYQVQALPPSKL